LKKKYRDDGAEVVRLSSEDMRIPGIKFLGEDFVCINNSYVRHDTKRLAQTIINLVEKSLFSRDNKMSTYYYKNKFKNLAQ